MYKIFNIKQGKAKQSGVRVKQSKQAKVGWGKAGQGQSKPNRASEQGPWTKAHTHE